MASLEKYPYVYFLNTQYLQHFLSGAPEYPRHLLAANQEITLLILFPCRTAYMFLQLQNSITAVTISPIPIMAKTNGLHCVFHIPLKRKHIPDTDP